MKCRVCRGPAVIDLPRHNANFCAAHFTKFCRDQVERAISEFDMLSPGDRVLVAVSGGKDSLAVWHLLRELGYEADGLHVHLGIGGYSSASARMARAHAEALGARLVEVDLREDYGFDVPTGAEAARRTPCSACGLSKRHVFDRAAVDGGYDALATGHNLDDEAAVLFGNVLRWQMDYLARQHPVLPARAGLPRKVKPLVRLGERETAAYCLVSGIDYLVEECPMSAGNKHLAYKAALNDLEVESPGTKANFYLSFLRQASPLLEPVGESGREGLGRCERCGAPSPSATCAFCRLRERAATAEPVTLRARPAPGAGPTTEDPT